MEVLRKYGKWVPKTAQYLAICNWMPIAQRVRARRHPDPLLSGIHSYILSNGRR